MEKHEVVNEIIEYLEYRAEATRQEMIGANQSDTLYLEGNLETYEHLIAKFEDDFR